MTGFLDAQDRPWLAMKEKIGEVIEKERMLPLTRHSLQQMLDKIGTLLLNSAGVQGFITTEISHVPVPYDSIKELVPPTEYLVDPAHA
jgi:hypothetical protein